jgi:hypothetical protein
MCPISYGLGSRFNETVRLFRHQFYSICTNDPCSMAHQHFSLYKDAIDYITIKKGSYAILDPHNVRPSFTL